MKNSWQQWPGGISIAEWRLLNVIRSLRVWMLVFWRMERYGMREWRNSDWIMVSWDDEERASGSDGVEVVMIVAPRDWIFFIAARDSFVICICISSLVFRK